MFGYTIIVGDSMRRISIFIMFAICFGMFIPVVNADELSLDDSNIAAITATVGGRDKEIIQIDSNNSYQYYYKYVKIKDDSFADYVKNKKIADTSTDGSDTYIQAAAKASSYATEFAKLIPTVSKPSDVTNWTKSTDNNINISNVTYKAGSHNGYVLAVAAVKNGDANVYITRLILESKSSSTLGQISYDNNGGNTEKPDPVVINDDNNGNDNNNDNNNDVDVVDKKTEENPNTGIEDYALYLAPISIVLGSAILLKKSYA